MPTKANMSHPPLIQTDGDLLKNPDLFTADSDTVRSFHAQCADDHILCKNGLHGVNVSHNKVA